MSSLESFSIMQRMIQMCIFFCVLFLKYFRESKSFFKGLNLFRVLVNGGEFLTATLKSFWTELLVKYNKHFESIPWMWSFSFSLYES